MFSFDILAKNRNLKKIYCGGGIGVGMLSDFYKESKSEKKKRKKI